MQPSEPLPYTPVHPWRCLSPVLKVLQHRRLLMQDSDRTIFYFLLFLSHVLLSQDLPSTAEIETRVTKTMQLGPSYRNASPGKDRPHKSAHIGLYPIPQGRTEEPCNPGVCVYLVRGADRADGYQEHRE